MATDLADGMASTTTPDPEAAAVLGQVKLGCGRAMLQTLDDDLCIAYALGEIMGVDQREADEALGISDVSNPCRGARRRERAIELGRLEPRDAVNLASRNRGCYPLVTRSASC